MAEKKKANPSDSAEPNDKAKPVEKKKKKKQEASFRETKESIAITFIIAFLVKTFVADAYVIPTGSMGPTLYGRQKEVTCTECGHCFALGASYEVQPDSVVLLSRITKADCVNCGARFDVFDVQPNNGDRIFVNKQIDAYNRFDVVVFKNPEQAQENYIKRLIGLPGETIRIRKGDIWAKATPDAAWQVVRKDNRSVQRAIQLNVYDDRHPARKILSAGWPERWQPAVFDRENSTNGFWTSTQNSINADRENRTYQIDESADFNWLRYRHFASTFIDWDQLERQGDLAPQPSLITDYCRFNAITSSMNIGNEIPSFDFGAYWVGDLTINFVFAPKTTSQNGELLMELVEGADTFQCRWQANGELQMLRINTTTRETIETLGFAKQAFPTKPTSIAFANVDDRLTLWVNEQHVSFDQSGEYLSTDLVTVDMGDLAPCGIATRNLTGQISELVLQRDLYYQNDIVESPENFVGRQQPESECGPVLLDKRDPIAYQQNYNRAQEILRNKHRQFGEYKLNDDEYLMMGDNSSRSQDARMFSYIARPYAGNFSHRHAVQERHLIGKALCIWWPHGIPVLNDGKGFALRKHVLPLRAVAEQDNEELVDYAHPTFRFPFLPNIGRMKAIR